VKRTLLGDSVAEEKSSPRAGNNKAPGNTPAQSPVPWYYSLFETGVYVDLLFSVSPESTVSEVSFIAKVLRLPPGGEVLDLCCGFGRHTIPLAQRGFRMTGLDSSAHNLELARSRASDVGADVTWILSDMRRIDEHIKTKLDAVICMDCSFGYLEDDEEDRRALNSISSVLKDGGVLLLDVLNRDAVIRSMTDRTWNRRGDFLILGQHTFDVMSSRYADEYIIVDALGERLELSTSVRLYTRSELEAMLMGVGMHPIGIYGSYAKQPFAIDNRRMIILSQYNK
jgi:SAM-dependent methyltransferase